jgi:hypothetical protein
MRVKRDNAVWPQWPRNTHHQRDSISGRLQTRKVRLATNLVGLRPAATRPTCKQRRLRRLPGLICPVEWGLFEPGSFLDRIGSFVFATSEMDFVTLFFFEKSISKLVRVQPTPHIYFFLPTQCNAGAHNVCAHSPL